MTDLAAIGLEALQAELQRRQDADGQAKPACGTTNRQGEYNVPIHVFAVFLILFVSTIACAFPVIARRFPWLPIPHRFLFLSRHFGTGVLLATAFIHLLPTAFTSMTDPCLPRFWNETYPPMPGLVAMIAVFAVVCIEQFFATRGARHDHGGGALETLGFETEYSNTQQTPSGHLPLHQISHPIDTPTMDTPDTTYDKSERKTSLDSDPDMDALDAIAEESAVLNRPQVHKRSGSVEMVPHQDPQKMFLQCLLLEAGILFHSIFIGMAVSVATGTAFVVLLIAISFHQTFEGFALGARIANLIPILFDARSPKPWLMCLAYGLTTPVGQILGLALHRMYDPNSEAGLLTVGITNAVSSGLLLFAGLVQLVAEDFLADASYHVLKGRRRIEANLAVALGGLLMAAVGAFA